MKKLTKSIIKNIFKPRKADSHKGDHGHALIIAGNLGKMGATVIASKACLRSGVGLVTVNIPKEERFIIQTAIPEAMVNFRTDLGNELENYSAIAIGPGLGLNEVKLISAVFNNSYCPLLLDADALNMLAADKKLFTKIPPQTIITPHPKEFDRLFGVHVNHQERILTAVNQAKLLDIIIVLKGAKTIITYNGIVYFNTTGNAGLAKGGSGDALTGIIAAFLAQGYEPFKAAQLGVFMHGLAADLSLKKQSVESLLISDVIENMGKAFKSIYPS
jgi:NAD(P)H-hydrate epimerase